MPLRKSAEAQQATPSTQWYATPNDHNAAAPQPQQARAVARDATVRGEAVLLDSIAATHARDGAARSSGASCWSGYTPPADALFTKGDAITIQQAMLQAAIDIIPGVAAKRPEAAGTLEALGKALTRQLDVLTPKAADTTPLNDGDVMERITPKSLPATLYGQIEATAGLPKDSLRTEWKDQYIRNTSNKTPWVPIENAIELGNAPVVSRCTPLNSAFGPQYGPEGKDYGQTGLCSMTPRLTASFRDPLKENLRVTNCWVTELVDSTTDTTVFCALRSGALAGKFTGDVNKGVQATVARENAQELLEAAILQDIKQHPDTAHGDRVINLVSIDLMSSWQESGKVAHQEEALAEAAKYINANGIAVRLPRADGSSEVVHMRPTVQCHIFRAGVNNMGSFSIAQGPANKEAFREFLKVYNDHKAAQPEASHALDDALVADIKGKLGEGHSYEMPAKLATLAFRSGCQVHFNCKSGKDRTGMMDAESKLFASQMHQADQKGATALPPYEFKDADPRRADLHRLIFEGGNMEITKMNTGARGLKIAPVPTLDQNLIKRLGGEETLLWVQGGKRYTNIDDM